MKSIFLGVILLACTQNDNTSNINLEENSMQAIIKTTQGNMVIELEYEKTPITVANFIGLAEGTMKNSAKDLGNPYYNGLIFHRVIQNFMIQGGCPDGTGSGSPGYQFPDEFHPDLKHDRAGILSMANAGPATNGSQFFITLAATPHLDGKHSVFGRVVEGMDVLQTIGSVKTVGSPTDKPIEDVIIKEITIVRKGTAKNFDSNKVFSEEIEKAKKEEESNRLKNEKIIKELKKGATVTKSGLAYKIINKGKGNLSPKSNSIVTVHYTGKFIDGTIFDSSVQRGQPATFALNQVIRGWGEALQLMVVGDKWTLIIPSDLGYGDRGYPGVIPPKATLIFDVELLEIGESGEDPHKGHNHE